MEKKKLESLIEEFPIIYRSGNFAFECSEGWYDLLHELSEKVEAIALVLLVVFYLHRFLLAQSAWKSKFAGLRYYVYNSTDEADKLIREAEGKSYKICEYCGEPGKQVGKGWVSTLCEKCAIEQKSKSG